MNTSRFACAAGAATVVLLAGCDRTGAAVTGPQVRGTTTLVAAEDALSGRASLGDGLDRDSLQGFGIRPTGSTANGITP